IEWPEDDPDEHPEEDEDPAVPQVQRRVEPDQRPGDEVPEWPDDRPEYPPPVRIHVLHPIPERPQPIVLLRTHEEPKRECAIAPQRQRGGQVRLVLYACRSGDDPTESAVLTDLGIQNGRKEVLALECH